MTRIALFVCGSLLLLSPLASAHPPNPHPPKTAPTKPMGRAVLPPHPGTKALAPNPSALLRRIHQQRQKLRNFRVRSFFKKRRYRVRLLTIGQGDWLFTYFGHNAIRLTDLRLQRDLNFNFGTFGGDNPAKLVMDYIQFRMRYWLSLAYPGLALRRYRDKDRSYRERDILLTPTESHKLATYLRTHALRKNRFYSYHHYTSNCSTKIRDALLKVIGPSFKEKAMIKRGATYRKLVMQKTRPNPFVMLFMDFGMGPYADRELTWWEEMFLPDKLESYMASTFWKQKRGRPLVSKVNHSYKRKAGAPWPFEPISLIYLQLMVLAGLGFWLRKGRRFRVWARWVFAWFALLGSILAFMMFLTKMPEPPSNANIILFHPFHWMIWWWASKKRWALPEVQQMVRWYLIIHVVLGALYLLLKLVGIVPVQTNMHYIVYAMGLFGLTAWILREHPPTAEEQVSPKEAKKAEAEDEQIAKAA